MFKNYTNKLISVFVIINLLVIQPINATTGITASQRTVDIQDQMVNSGVPSDLPIAGYSDFFDKETVSLIKNFDISNYSGRKIMIGYGLPDKNSNNCKMMEKPNPNGGNFEKSDYDSNFLNFYTYNDHSYGISNSNTTYDNCLVLANKFGGYPVVIDSAGENNSIKHSYLKSGGGSGEELWIGVSFANKANPKYFNAFGNVQNYFNWVSSSEERSFDINKANVYMDYRGKWYKENGGLVKKCVIEIESPVYYKPIRSCAPWWKVIREFKNDRSSLYDTKDFHKLLNADIPEKLNICTKYDMNKVTPPNSTNPTREVTCTSYQSLTEKPECQLNISLPQCYVNECSGYIQNACRHKSEKIVGKGYIKGEVKTPSGTWEEVKIKDNVKTHTFQCPPSSISMKNCLETSSVIIFPQECTMYGSQCFELKKCVQAAQSNAQIDDCYDTTKGGFYCKRIYASRDIPPKLNPDGSIDVLYGKCTDPNDQSKSELVEFKPNILDKKNKHCVEWEILEKTENIIQKCKTERNYTEHTVDTSITEKDAYEDNENCVRVDKVKDSTTVTNVTMDIDLYNFSKLKVTQTYIDEDERTLTSGSIGDDSYYTIASVPVGVPDGSETATPPDQTCDLSSTACNGYTTAWSTRNSNIFLDGATLDTKDQLVSRIESGKIYIKGTISELPESTCNTYAVDHGFDSYITGTPSYSKNTVADSAQCIYTLSTMAGDAGISEIVALTTDAIRYSFANDMSKDDCLQKASCLDGTFDESPYSSSWTSTGKCVVSADGSGSPSSYLDRLKEKAGCSSTPNDPLPVYTEGDCSPDEDKGIVSLNTTIDGLQSILFFEEFITGGWGYFQNSTTYPYKSNQVFVTTSDDITNLRAFPLLEISTISDRLTYKGKIKHVGWRKKKADVALAVAGGVGAGLLSYSPMLLMGMPASLIIGIIVLVIILLLAKSKEMDEQAQAWVLYKNIADSRYIKGPYETRTKMAVPFIFKQTTKSNGYAELNFSPPANTNNYLYLSVNTHTGINLPKDYLETLSGYTTVKKNLLLCIGLPQSEVTKTITDSLENRISTGYPKCKWYKPWCEKHQVKADASLTQTLIKPTTSVYFGATETLTILVPYKGDYTLKAYNKYDEIVAERDITEDAFSNYYDPLSLPYGQVMFGSAMKTSVNLGAGSACTDDMMVEWGGGVSGIYWENDNTGYNNGCAKSDDTYVAEQAMVKIEVIPKNLNKGFIHILEKPLPYANRVFIASLEKLAKRKYRCYDPFTNCDDEDFKQVEANN